MLQGTKGSVRVYEGEQVRGAGDGGERRAVCLITESEHQITATLASTAG